MILRRWRAALGSCIEDYFDDNFVGFAHGAHVALIISQALPKHVEHFDLVDNVWVAHPRCALPVAVALRQSLIELSNSRFVQQGQETKMEQVYQYLTGIKFRQRIEAVIEKFNDMREDLDRERRFMGKQWSKREAQILAVVGSTVGMVGDLLGIAGKAMPAMPSLDMPLLEASAVELRGTFFSHATLHIPGDRSDAGVGWAQFSLDLQPVEQRSHHAG